VVVAQIDGRQMGILLFPLRDVRLVVVPPGQEVVIAEMEEKVGAFRGNGGPHIVRVRKIHFAHLCGEVLAGRIQLADETLIDLHASAANGERVARVDSADHGKRVVAGLHLLRRQGEQDAVCIGQLDVPLNANEGDGPALDDGDAQLVREKAHHGSFLHPGNPFEFEPPFGKGNEEEVASDVGAENRKEVGASQLAVAEGLNGGGGVDAKAGVMVEERAHSDDRREKDAGRDQEAGDERYFAPGGPDPGRKEAAPNGNTARGAQERLFCVVLGIGFGWTGTIVSPPGRRRRCGSRTRTRDAVTADRRTTEVRRFIEQRYVASVCAGFSHA